ncbi:MAG: secretin N-terminal domain-containing protein [Bryobacteraceae bacterium]|jgi:hypothetical protein
MKRILLTLALLALPLAAQPKKQAPPPGTPVQTTVATPKQTAYEPKQQPQVQKLFVLKYADSRQLANLLQSGLGVTVSENPGMHALAVSATPSAMAAVDDAIKRLDVPSAAPQDVELMVYLLIGAQADDAASAAPPKELDGVITQLKSAFTYKSYRMMDVLALRTRTGQQVETTGNGGSVQIGGISQSIITQFRIKSVTVGNDGAIRIDGLLASNRVPMAMGSAMGSNTQFSYQTLSLSADVDVKEGQKLVVGKMGMNTNEAMFVVLTARVVQ